MVTIIVSVNPGMPEVLFFNFFRLLSREVSVIVRNGVETATIIETLPAGVPSGASHHIRARQLQAHRQRVVDLYLPKRFRKEGDFVLFVDADIVEMTEGLLWSLVAECDLRPSYSIVAPLVLLEKSHWRPYRWYDTAGFVHNGERTALYPPWFSSEVYAAANLPIPRMIDDKWEFPPNTWVELNGSVGCVYCAHALLFRSKEHGFHGDFAPTYTEHYPLCQHAIRHGGQLVVRMDLTATHAFLPKYGEMFH